MRLAHALIPCPVIVASAVAVSSCEANQTTTGGEALFDASYPTTNVEAGACTPDASDADPGWAVLYADLFGPTSLGQCGSASRTNGTDTSSCHHDSSGSGAMSSGFICGDTQSDCYAGITSPMASFVGQQVVTPCSPETSYLTQVLRHDGGGIMPYFPQTVVYSDSDMGRVSAWIAAGAQNN